MEKFIEFNKTLKDKSYIEDGNKHSYQRVELIWLEDYDEVPPPDALDCLAKAKEKAIFDRFTLAKVEWVHGEKAPDPIIFGKVEGYSDLFPIAQWDDDISVIDFIDSVDDLK